MKKYWFIPKSYGYGFYPITWEGWISVFIFIGLLLISAYVNGFFTLEIGTKSGLNFILDVCILSSLFTVIFKDKIKDGLQWRWGSKKISDTNKDNETG